MSVNGYSMGKCLVLLAAMAWLAGCSNTAHRAAPIENVYVKSDKSYNSIKGKKYKVKQGDTLYAIAWRAGKDYRQLARINAIKTPYQIFPGQTIILTPNSDKRSKNKVSTPIAKSVTKISAKNVSKTLAHQKQGEYRQPKEKPNVVAKTKKKQQQRPQSRKQNSSTKSYSNKIRQWVWPTTGKVIAGFSTKENGNKGIDITAKAGTTIVSAADGKVVYYGNALRGYGNLVIIKHNDDYLSAYAHNRKVFVKEKQQVKAGQKIAEMGDSDSPNTKLHFEVRYRGKSVNPIKYLPRR